MLPPIVRSVVLLLLPVFILSAQAQARLKNAKGTPERIRTFASAPTDYEGLARIDLAAAFALNVAPLLGRLEGQFTTARAERVYLHKNGTYSVEGPDYRATVHANGTISAESGGYSVISWPNGAQQWTTPDGRKVNF